MSILSQLFSNYGDDLARQFVDHADDAVLAGIRNYGDDTLRATANQAPKKIYHGTNKIFENFDESIPSTWFTDNADDIANTGLSNNGGKINIMERELPGDLKLADWDLADRLTKQQLIDRGYAGIAYTGSGTSGNDTYYEIFKPNQVLRKPNKTALRSLTSDDGITPLYRGQKYGVNDLLYNKNGGGAAGAGTSPSISNAYYFTPNSKKTVNWTGENGGTIQIPMRDNDVITLQQLQDMIAEADPIFADPRKALDLYNTNPTRYDLMEAVADRQYRTISELTKKPFIQPDSGQGEELMETLFFPDTNPTLTDIYRELLHRSGGKTN